MNNKKLLVEISGTDLETLHCAFEDYTEQEAGDYLEYEVNEWVNSLSEEDAAEILKNYFGK